MSWVQHFFQWFAAWKVWHALFHNFMWMDWIFLIAVIVAVILGVLRGFGYFFGKLVRALILVFSVLLLAPVFSKWATAHLTFAKGAFWEPFFFIVLSLLLFWVLRKISKMQAKQSLPQFHPFWDNVIGAGAGFFTVLLVASFVTQLFLMLPGKKLHAVFEKNGSHYGFVLNHFTPQLVEDALAPIRMVVNQRVSRT